MCLITCIPLHQNHIYTDLSPLPLWSCLPELSEALFPLCSPHFAPIITELATLKLCILFQSTEARGGGQWTQVPLECSLPEGSVACILSLPVWFGRSAELSVGPEPSRTSLSLLEGPSSLVKSPLSRYMGLIKGKYFNNTENGRCYSVVGGKKACSKTVCDLILFCQTPQKYKYILKGKTPEVYASNSTFGLLDDRVILIFLILPICSTVISTVDMVFS